MPSQNTHRIAHVEDTDSFAVAKQQLETDYPELSLHADEVKGETALRAEYGGMRVFWLYRGEGEVYLPAGYRTREGDGHSLPGEYVPERPSAEFTAMLDALEKGLTSISAEAAPHVQLILNRRKGSSFVGDIAAYLWGLEHAPRPWSRDAHVEETLVALFDVYREQGYSVKQTDSCERIMAGDQIAVCGHEEVPVRGDFVCISIEKKDRKTSHVSTVRRLRYLIDTAGGCSFDFEPLRRLPLTWYMDYPGQEGDGVNFVNAHVVNIPSELSSTHFHPCRPRRGGLLQSEMYLVLDPRDYGIINKDREAAIILYPDLGDLRCFERYPLKSGDFVYIPPGVGHRGLDVFVNILTIPGFKPHNEFYIDQDILDRTGGKAPCNENGLARKNYARLEEFL